MHCIEKKRDSTLLRERERYRDVCLSGGEMMMERLQKTFKTKDMNRASSKSTISTRLNHG